jgi:hypothetical protein
MLVRDLVMGLRLAPDAVLKLTADLDYNKSTGEWPWLRLEGPLFRGLESSFLIQSNVETASRSNQATGPDRRTWVVVRRRDQFKISLKGVPDLKSRLPVSLTERLTVMDVSQKGRDSVVTFLTPEVEEYRDSAIRLPRSSVWLRQPARHALAAVEAIESALSPEQEGARETGATPSPVSEMLRLVQVLVDAKVSSLEFHLEPSHWTAEASLEDFHSRLSDFAGTLKGKGDKFTLEVPRQASQRQIKAEVEALARRVWASPIPIVVNGQTLSELIPLGEPQGGSHRFRYVRELVRLQLGPDFAGSSGCARWSGPNAISSVTEQPESQPEICLQVAYPDEPIPLLLRLGVDRGSSLLFPTHRGVALDPLPCDFGHDLECHIAIEVKSPEPSEAELRKALECGRKAQKRALGLLRNNLKLISSPDLRGPYPAWYILAISGVGMLAGLSAVAFFGDAQEAARIGVLTFTALPIILLLFLFLRPLGSRLRAPRWKPEHSGYYQESLQRRLGAMWD